LLSAAARNAVLDLASAWLGKADRDLGGDLHIDGIVWGAVAAPHSQAAEATKLPASGSRRG
jgi:hypothetical protein